MRIRPVSVFILVLVFLTAAQPFAVALTVSPRVQSGTPEAAPNGIFSVGVAAGDGYYPVSAVVDEGRQLAFVYNTDSADRRPVISVIDLAHAQPLRVIRTESTQAGEPGRLLLAADGTLLLVDQERDAIFAVDGETGRLDRLLSDATDATLSPDGRFVYVLGQGTLRAFKLVDLKGRLGPQWRARGRFDRVAGGDDRVAVTLISEGFARTLLSFDAATGAEVARTVIPDYVSALSAGPDGSWVLVTTGEKPKLVRFDRSLEQTHETVIPYAYEVSLDAPRQRYLLSGFQSDGKSSSSRILGYSAADLKQVAVHERAGSEIPTHFVNWGPDRILGYRSSGPPRLEVLDSGLDDVGRMIFGARVLGMALDEGRGLLLAADEHDRTHVFDVRDGRQTSLWDGGAPLAFDEKNGLLYANLPGKVISRDIRGSKVAELPQEGWPAPDPNRDLVYIVSNGVTMYDRVGKKLGVLASTFPKESGFYPNTYAQSARVNPVSGHLGVVINNGVPGSNNGSYLRVYPPKTDSPVEVPAQFSFVTDMAFDGAGNFYVTYSPARANDAVQVLSPAGKELRRLSGRSGQIALDSGAGVLYLLTRGLVTRAAVDALVPHAFLQGPDEVERVVFSPSRQTLYVYSGRGPSISRVALDDLVPLDMSPQASAPPPDATLEQLYIAPDRTGDWIVGRYSATLYRTRDGKSWEMLPVGTVSSWSTLAVAPKGVLFWAGNGYDGGYGVWRSTDSGSTWEPLFEGLRDMRWAGNGITAASADEAYAVNRTDGLLRWNAGRGAWERMNPATQPGTSPGELRVAPGGRELFNSGWDTLRKSTDGGRTWKALKPPSRSGNIIGFSGFYTVTQTLYGMWGDITLAPVRSEDGGETWQPLRVDVDLGHDYYLPEIAASGWDTYLLARPYTGDESLLLRSTDNGETWQRAAAESSRGVYHIAQGTDLRLWLGGKTAVTAVDPEKIKWSQAPGSNVQPVRTATSTPARRPSATRTATPAPTLARCSRSLAGAEAEAAARAPELGCPAGAVAEVSMARQAFERGQMIWRGDNRVIYVLGPNARWQSFGDRWLEGQPESDPALVAPAGVEQPVRGFGKVWRDQLGGSKAEIGWALGKEQGVRGTVQAWGGGLVFRFGGEMIVLINGGAVK